MAQQNLTRTFDFRPFSVPRDDSRHRDCAFCMSAAMRTSRFARSPSARGVGGFKDRVSESKLRFVQPALSFAGLRRWTPSAPPAGTLFLPCPLRISPHVP